MKPVYRFDEDGAGQVEVNMSPLIDCVFLLLIFFIVTTVFVEETGVDVNKPQAASARDLEKNSLMFALTADGSIVYGGRKGKAVAPNSARRPARAGERIGCRCFHRPVSLRAAILTCVAPPSLHSSIRSTSSPVRVSVSTIRMTGSAFSRV